MTRSDERGSTASKMNIRTKKVYIMTHILPRGPLSRDACTITRTIDFQLLVLKGYRLAPLPTIAHAPRQGMSSVIT